MPSKGPDINTPPMARSIMPVVWPVTTMGPMAMVSWPACIDTATPLIRQTDPGLESARTNIVDTCHTSLHTQSAVNAARAKTDRHADGQLLERARLRGVETMMNQA